MKAQEQLLQFMWNLSYMSLCLLAHAIQLIVYSSKKGRALYMKVHNKTRSTRHADRSIDAVDFYSRWTRYQSMSCFLRDVRQSWKKSKKKGVFLLLIHLFNRVWQSAIILIDRLFHFTFFARKCCVISSEGVCVFLHKRVRTISASLWTEPVNGIGRCVTFGTFKTYAVTVAVLQRGAILMGSACGGGLQQT